MTNILLGIVGWGIVFGVSYWTVRRAIRRSRQ
jgi:hypothetical protein